MAAICSRCGKIISTVCPIHDCVPPEATKKRRGPGYYDVTCEGRTFEVTRCDLRGTNWGGYWWYVTENQQPPDLDPKRTLRECVDMIQRFCDGP